MLQAPKRKAADMLPAPSDQADDVEQSKKAKITIPTNLELLYPFWYGAGDAEVNPPFVNPGGPFYQEDGYLKIRLQNPIALMSQSVGLKRDSTLGLNSLGQLGIRVSTSNGIVSTDYGLAASVDGKSITFDAQGQLQATVDPEGPVEIGEHGLNLRIDSSTLKVDDDWDLAVKVDPAGCIDHTPAGLNVNVDDTLLIATGDDGQTKELGVHLNHAGPITADADGLDLEIDSSLKVAQSNDQGVLGVQLHTEAGISNTTAGLRVNTQEPISITGNTVVLGYDDNVFAVLSGKLDIKRETNGGIEATANGLKLLVSDPLSVNTNNTLVLKTSENNALVVSGGALGVKVADAGSLTNASSGLAVNAAAAGGLQIRNNSLEIKLQNNSSIQSTTDGIAVVLAADGGIQTLNNSLAVKLPDNSGLQTTANGLALKINDANSLVIENGVLFVKTPENSGLINNNQQGLKVNTRSDGGLDVVSNGVGVRLPANSGLRTDADGLAVALDGHTALVIEQGFLLVKTADNSGLSNSTAGLKIQLINNGGLKLANGSLGLQVNDAGGIESTGSGVGIKLANDSGLKVSNAGLSLLPGLRPVTFSCGDYDFGGSSPDLFVYNCLTYTNLPDYREVDDTRVWKAKCKLHLANLGGMVTGTFYIRWMPATNDTVVYEVFNKPNQSYLLTFYLSGKPSIKSGTGINANTYALSTVNPSGIAGAVLSQTGNYFVPAADNDKLPTMNYTLQNAEYIFKYQADNQYQTYVETFFPNSTYSKIKFNQCTANIKPVLSPPVGGVQDVLLAISIRINHPNPDEAWRMTDDQKPYGAYMDLRIPITYAALA